VLALIEAKHLCGKGLKRLQQLAIVLRHERNIEPTEFDVDLARFKALRIVCAVTRGDAVLEAQTTQLVEIGEESSYFLCGFLQIGDRHNDLVSQSPAGVWKSGRALLSRNQTGAITCSM